MKKIGILSVICLLAVAMLGCGKKVSVEETTIIFDKDGSVIQAVVDDLDESLYDKKEVESYVKEAVKEYTATAGDKAVTLDSFKVKDNVVKMQLSFASVKDLAAFDNIAAFSGTVSEAMIAGYNFNTVFTAFVEGSGETVNYESADATHNVLGNVIVISENTCVQVPGTVTYVSAYGCEVVYKDTVRVNMNEATDSVVYIIYE